MRRVEVLVIIAYTLVGTTLWDWAVDHLPWWASLLVLVGILAVAWVIGRQLRRHLRNTGERP